LRTEPIVLEFPEIQKDRYCSIQLIHLYTWDFAYIGTRATGNGVGKFLLAVPNWKGEVPKGMTQ
jgi:hypothetical protein